MKFILPFFFSQSSQIDKSLKFKPNFHVRKSFRFLFRRQRNAKMSSKPAKSVKKIFSLIISRQLETGFVFFRVGREFLFFFLFNPPKTDFSPKISKFTKIRSSVFSSHSVLFSAAKSHFHSFKSLCVMVEMIICYSVFLP